MAMNLENDVRTWAKRELGNRVLWVEAGAGGTPGLPDLLLIMGDRLVPIELKLLKRRKGPVSSAQLTGVWAVEMRPAQLAVANKIIENGGKYFVLLGDKSENKVWLACFDEGNMRVKNGDSVKISAVENGQVLRLKIKMALLTSKS